MPFLKNNIHISESLLRAVIDTAVDGIMIINQDGEVQLYNAACERLFGYKADEVIGQNIKMLMPAPYREEHDGYLRAYRETGDARVIGIGREVTGQRKDGSQFPIGLSVGEALHKEERYFVGIIHDISDQKEAEENLRRAKDEAEAASHAKSDFLAVMSHEIRSPLHAIIATTGLLQRTWLREKQVRYVDTIQKSSEGLLEIVNRLLDLSKIEAGVLDIMEAQVEVQELLESVKYLWEPKAEQKEIELFTRIARDVPSVVVVDADKIREILNNLIDNAVKFTEGGYIAVKVSLEFKQQELQNDQIILHFDVKDTGIGIAETQQTNLFERFEQVDGSFARKHEGAGLGLAICKELTELLGGKIGVSSEQAKGSCFWFSIPCRIPRFDKIPDAARESENREFHSKSTDNPLTILVAEDNPENQMIIRDILEYHGHHVDIVSNGQEAVRTAAKRSYDLILMDVRMPIMDGLEATKCIRKEMSQSRRVPIVAMTAHAMNGASEQCIASGMDDYISKPFTIERVDEVVSKYVASREGSASRLKRLAASG